MGRGREGLVMGRRWEVQGAGKEGKENDGEEKDGNGNGERKEKMGMGR